MAAYKDEERNTWWVSFHYKDWTGKNCRKVKRGFETKKDALEWERSFLLKQAKNLDMTFADFADEYEKDMKNRLKYNTWCTKRHVIRTKLIPYFGNRKMCEITPKDIINWQNEMMTLKDKNGKAYSPTYLKTLQAQLSAIFNHAVRYYDLAKNPVHRVGALGKGKADEMLFWTKDEYLRFSEAIKDKQMSYMAFQILYWCGIRVGELLALTYKDFDFDRHVICIKKSYQRIEGEDYITDPKTEKSNRNVAMPEFLENEIKEYINQLYIFEDDRLFPFTKRLLHHEMERGTKKSGVKKIRIHDLRHSHISLLISLGYSAVAIGSRVGHESVDITYRYAHMFPTEQQDMAASLNKLNEKKED